MKKSLLSMALVFFFPFFLDAQEAKPIIRFSPFYTRDIGFEEVRFVESLIQSYLSDFGEVVNYFDDISGEPAQSGMFPDSWTRAPDYVLTGSIYFEREFRVFTLEIHNTKTGETSRLTSSHKTASDMVLRARSLVEAAFGSSGETGALPEEGGPGEEEPDILTESAVAGTWRGEPGIEMIRLQQGGRGTAFFSSGARMNLSYTIENNTLKVRQDSPNTERYYYPLPYGAARQLSAEADPMTWELFLYAGGTHLRGFRRSAEAKIEENMLVELVPDTIRETEWIRTR
ncbi:MAG: hypothetical protein LBQ67_01265 [Treponema sp.]|jgi:hypothetical protein|nr:hypothetical protein [Treponema sp.]